MGLTEKVKKDWKKSYNNELHGLCSSLIRIIKLRVVGWVGHVTRTVKKINTYMVLVKKLKRNRPL